MTQDELDALMAGNVNLDEIKEEVEEFKHEIDAKDSHGHKDLSDHDLVAQLGSVTTESEQKATEVFDLLEVVLSLLDKSDANLNNTKEINGEIRNIIFEIMSVMQYQDIHRQRIERVINTMRTISQVMSHTLDSVSGTFAPSAKHIAGDSDTVDLVDDDELEALIAQMAKK